MEKPFEKLKQNLLQRGISLENYYNFLKYTEEDRYPTLNTLLQKQRVDLVSYESFLEETISPTMDFESAEISSSAAESEQNSLLNLGIYLLQNTNLEIGLKELNEVLQTLSKAKETTFHLLQRLLQNRKIKTDVFLLLSQRNWEDECFPASVYQIRRCGDCLEFYVVQSKEVKSFGKYQVVEELGRGGMGVVYKVYHPILNQTFALKVLLSGKKFSEMKVKRFFREAQTMAKLNHPGIVQIIDSGEERNGDGVKYYFSMELVSGRTLEAWLKEKHTLREKLEVILKCLDALHYVHEQGIIHRDIKPQNILVSPNGEPKITDFGLVKDLQLNRKSQKLTQTGAILGTPTFMSPEQISENSKDITPLADIYSLGVCLYRMLTLRCPFESNDIKVLFDKVLDEEPLPPSKLRSEIHPDLDRIVLKSLEKIPQNRYLSAQLFAQDLESFLTGLPISVKPVTKREKALKWIKKNRVIFAFISLCLLVCFVFLGVLKFAKIRENKAQFLSTLALSIKAQKEAEEVKGKGFVARSKKVKHLFYALNSINQALQLRPGSRQAENEKWKVGNLLISLANKEKEYDLSLYIAKELQELKSLGHNERKQLIQWIKQKKAETEKKHLKEFEAWIELLRSGSCKEEFYIEAIFDISKMPETIIFEKLLKFIEEGADYFLRQQEYSASLLVFYQTMARALGRLEDTKAAKPLWKALQQMSMLSFSNPERRESVLLYMASLAEALGNSKAKGYAELFGQFRYKMGQNSLFWDRSRLAYKKIVLIDGADSAQSVTAEDFLHRGMAKRRTGDLKGAIKDFTQAFKLNPKEVRALMNRGNSKYQLNDFKGAFSDFSEAIRLDPRFYDAFNGRGSVRQALKEYQGAMEDYNEALRINPKFIAAYTNRGVLKARSGNYKGALQDLSKVITLDPQSVGAYNNRAMVRSSIGNFKGAIEDYSQAIKLNPSFSKAFNNRGALKYDLKDFDGAIKDFTTATELDPNYFDAYSNRGNAKREKGDLAGALLDYQASLRKNPKNVAAYVNRGRTRFLLKDLEGAIADYTTAIQLEPSSLHYSSRAYFKSLQKDFTGAIQDYDKVLQLEPRDFTTYYNRGLTKFNARDRKGALNDFKMFLRLTKNKMDRQTKQSRRWIYKKFPELVRE